MTQPHDNTDAVTGKHLSKDERSKIEVLKKENDSNRAIAWALERSFRLSIIRAPRELPTAQTTQTEWKDI